MRGKLTLYVDQYGNKFYARTTRELRAKVPGKLSKMYVDKIAGPHAGKRFHVGHVVGQHWFTAYVPVEIAA